MPSPELNLLTAVCSQVRFDANVKNLVLKFSWSIKGWPSPGCFTSTMRCPSYICDSFVINTCFRWSLLGGYAVNPKLRGYNPDGALNSFESHGKPSCPFCPLERHLIMSPFLIGPSRPLMTLINPPLLILVP
jgi:hypothetical protein